MAGARQAFLRTRESTSTVKDPDFPRLPILLVKLFEESPFGNQQTGGPLSNLVEISTAHPQSLLCTTCFPLTLTLLHIGNGRPRSSCLAALISGKSRAKPHVHRHPTDFAPMLRCAKFRGTGVDVALVSGAYERASSASQPSLIRCNPNPIPSSRPLDSPYQ